MRFIAPVCAFLFPLLLIVMEAAFKADSSFEWAFSGPAAAATAVALLISAMRPTSPKKKSILGGRYEAALVSELNTIYVLAFVTIAAIGVWGWVIYETTLAYVPTIFGLPRPIVVGFSLYFVCQVIVGVKEAKYG